MKLVILILVVLSVAFADTCGGNCPSGKCGSCPCGTSKNMADIAGWCAKYSWNQACCNVLSHMKVEETPTLCSSTPTELLMSDSGKSTNQTGAHAAEEKPHVIYNPT